MNADTEWIRGVECDQQLYSDLKFFLYYGSASYELSSTDLEYLKCENAAHSSFVSSARWSLYNMYRFFLMRIFFPNVASVVLVKYFLNRLTNVIIVFRLILHLNFIVIVNKTAESVKTKDVRYFFVVGVKRDTIFI